MFSKVDGLGQLSSASFTHNLNSGGKTYPVTNGDVDVVGSRTISSSHSRSKYAAGVAADDFNSLTALLDLLSNEFTNLAFSETIDGKEFLGYSYGGDIQQNSQVSSEAKTSVQNSGTVYEDELRYEFWFSLLELIEEPNERTNVAERKEARDEGSFQAHFLHFLINNLESGEGAHNEGHYCEILDRKSVV